MGENILLICKELLFGLTNKKEQKEAKRLILILRQYYKIYDLDHNDNMSECFDLFYLTNHSYTKEELENTFFTCEKTLKRRQKSITNLAWEIIKSENLKHLRNYALKTK